MLLNYLKENSDREFSIDALALELGEISGGKIGKSTIYRQVKELCRSGLLRRFRKEGKTVVYQYMEHVGDRICQFRIMEHQPAITFLESDTLGNPDRGGHGSTGKA